MLGGKLGEFQGKVTGQRILPADGAHPKTKTSFEISDTLLGIDATMMGTYWSPTGLMGCSTASARCRESS
jgi:hypothetical protein